MKAGSGDAVSGELDFVKRSVSKSSLPLELQSLIVIDREPKSKYLERINRYADDLLVFNDVQDIKQVELHCDCKVNSLSKYQGQFKFEFKKM